MLSKLVWYLNELDAVDFDAVNGQVQHKLEAVNHTVYSHDTSLNFYKTRVETQYNKLCQELDQYGRVFESLKREIRDAVAAQEKQYYANSLDLYQTAMRWDSDQHRLNRRLGIDDESNLILRSRLRSYTDWRVPGMIIHPGVESFIEEMVPLDPLYVVDTSLEIMDPAVSKFNEQYQARLCRYTINEDGITFLDQLPQQQFGCVFAYNFFNYKPIEVIERYLTELFNCLRPGGTVMFTFNDCDRAHGVALAEKNFMCYTPGSRIIGYAEDLGFDLVHRHVGQGDVAWLEFRKPGEIKTLRGGQTLAQIIRK